ncbi:MAG: hypothetical protein M0036_23630, partial [Desulfobacteraceae bacterium]|nr:hypothetical protein [Desulfobacteraceae bacterium]
KHLEIINNAGLNLHIVKVKKLADGDGFFSRYLRGQCPAVMDGIADNAEEEIDDGDHQHGVTREFAGQFLVKKGQGHCRCGNRQELKPLPMRRNGKIGGIVQPDATDIVEDNGKTNQREAAGHLEFPVPPINGKKKEAYQEAQRGKHNYGYGVGYHFIPLNALDQQGVILRHYRLKPGNSQGQLIRALPTIQNNL